MRNQFSTLCSHERTFSPSFPWNFGGLMPPTLPFVPIRGVAVLVTLPSGAFGSAVTSRTGGGGFVVENMEALRTNAAGATESSLIRGDGGSLPAGGGVAGFII